MGAKVSAHHSDKKALTEALREGDAAAVEHLITNHPELWRSRLDKATGNNAVHLAVLDREHQVLMQLVTIATSSTFGRASTFGRSSVAG